MKIAIIDDGVGAFATLSKLKYAVTAEYCVYLLNEHFPLGNLSKSQLMALAQQCVRRAEQDGCQAVVLSSIALSMAAGKVLAQQPVQVFGCEAPILHAGTYTASQVLVVGDSFTSHLAQHFPNVISVSLPQFPLLAESFADDRTVANYISENAEQHSGCFDCIAIANSSMNLYKNCFSRVFPNVQIFDSLEGVARKLRKKYKKNNRDVCSVCIKAENGEDLSAKYKFFTDEFC